MTRKSQTIASLAYQERRAKREALIAIEAEKKREAQMLKKKEFWFGVTSLIALMILGFFIWRTVVSFQTPTATEATDDEVIIPETGPSAIVEGSWLPVDGVGSLEPGQICIGDVKVAGVIQYDSGSGESTIVVNNSTQNVEIYAEWGASRITDGDLQSLIADQYITGCDVNRGSCSRVRIVTVSDGGIQTVEFLDREPAQ